MSKEQDIINKLEAILFSERIFSLTEYWNILSLFKKQKQIKEITFKLVEDFGYKIDSFKI